MIFKSLHLSRFYQKSTNFNLLFSRQYRITSFDTNRNETRFYAPGTVVWKNNSYTYNKNMIDLPFSQRSSSKVLKNYYKLKFNFKNDRNFRRSPLYKYNIFRLFPKNYLSLPLIRDGANKTTVSLYVYDRERKYIINELFFLKKLYKTKQEIRLEHNSDKNKDERTLKKIDKIKIQRLQNQYNRYLVEAFNKDVSKIALFLLNKNFILKTLLFHFFLKWVLSILRIKLLIFINKKNKKIKNKYNLFFVKSHIKKIKLIKGTDIFIHKFKKPMAINLRTLNYINVILMEHIRQFYSNNQNLKLLYSIFIQKCYSYIKNRYIRNEFFGIDLLSRLRLQINKFDSYVPILKLFLKKILSKKVEINVIDLKYFYMNSDTYSKAFSLILKKNPSNISLSKITRLIKVNNIHNNKFNINYDNIFTKRINLNSDINKKYKDTFHKTVQNMFRKNLVNNLNKNDKFKQGLYKSWQGNVNHVLNFLKHKWITGVRVEAKGRLSKRYGADRSRYMQLHVGNLKIMQHIIDPDLNLDKKKMHKLPRVALVRNRYTSNLQYSYVSSKMRTGSFGVKGWVSSN